MNLCFPINDDAGAATMLYGHFASAPQFLLIDTAGTGRTVIANCDHANPYAGCNPFNALRGRQLDAIVVDAIGDDALSAMNLCGFRVYRARSRSVAENLAWMAENSLEELQVQESAAAGRCTSGESGCNCSAHHHSEEEHP